MNDTAHGLILQQSDYRENALLLSVLSEEYGRISLIARGVKKMGSRNAGSVLLYSYGEFQIDYRPDRTMFILKSARTLKLHRTFFEDLNASSAAALIAECALAMSGEQVEEDGMILHLAEDSLDLIDGRKRIDIVTAVFLAQLLKTAGIGPDVDGCAVCGNPVVTAFSVKEGGFLCRQHMHAADAEDLSLAQLKQLRLICKAQLLHYDILAQRIDDGRWAIGLLAHFLQEHAGFKLRSWPLFERVFIID